MPKLTAANHGAATATGRIGSSSPISMSTAATLAQTFGTGRAHPEEGRPLMVALLLSTADTDLLAARAAAPAGGSPTRPGSTPADAPGPARRGAVVVVRLLGGRRAWPEGLDARARLRCPGGAARRRGGPGRRADGRARPCPPGWPPRRWRYLVEGGAGQPARAAPASCPTRCCSPARGSPRRSTMPEYGVHGGSAARDPARPTGRRRLLPGARADRQHRVRRRAVRRDRGGRAPTRCRCSAARCADAGAGRC